ncbi:MAG: STY0301 family protein [Pseudomonadota bacterium]
MHFSCPCTTANLATLLILGVLGNTVQAETHSIKCPLKVSADSIQVAKPPTGWTPFVATEFWLHSAGPMDGPPADLAVLMGEEPTKRSDRKAVTKWNLSGVFSGAKWIACNYGQGNEVILSQRINDTTKECIVTSSEHEFGRVSIEITCS